MRSLAGISPPPSMSSQLLLLLHSALDFYLVGLLFQFSGMHTWTAPKTSLRKTIEQNTLLVGLQLTEMGNFRKYTTHHSVQPLKSKLVVKA